MSTIRPDACRARFEADLCAVADFLNDCQLMGLRQPDGTYRRLGRPRIEMLAGFTLIRLQLAWENFVEAVFIRYMCGSTSASGGGPTLLQLRQRNIGAATAELLQGQPFVNWTYDETVSRASIYFVNGEPFTTPLGAVKRTIEDVAIVRNAIAHRSASAKDRFRNLVRRVIGYVPRGMTPGRFLLSAPSAGQESIIEGYTNDFATVAGLIVP